MNPSNWINGMLTDPSNHIPGLSSNPNTNLGSSTQPPYTNPNTPMPYYPNFQPSFASQEEQMLYIQFKMQQNTISSTITTTTTPTIIHHFPTTIRATIHLVDESKDEGEPLPTPTSKPREVEKEKVKRTTCTQDEEKLLAECISQIFEDPKTRCDQKKATFWYKIIEVYNEQARKNSFQERTKNMLTDKMDSNEYRGSQV